MNDIRAVYLIETPLDPARVADILAGEQSSGTFVRVAGETDALRARSRATVEKLEELAPLPQPSLPNALFDRKGETGPWRRVPATPCRGRSNLSRNILGSSIRSSRSPVVSPRS